MNDREKKVTGRIMLETQLWKLEKYSTVFLSQMALRVFCLKENQQPVNLEEVAAEAMQNVQDIYKETEELHNKRNIVVVSSKKCLGMLQESISNGDVPKRILEGDIVKNALDYLTRG